MIMRKPKNKKSKKDKKKVVGTKEDPATIKEKNDNSDDSLWFTCTQNPPKVVCKQAPKVLQKVVGKQVAKEPPRVVEISWLPKPLLETRPSHINLAIYPTSKVETQVQDKTIHLGKEIQGAKQSTQGPHSKC